MRRPGLGRPCHLVLLSQQCMQWVFSAACCACCASVHGRMAMDTPTPPAGRADRGRSMRIAD